MKIMGIGKERLWKGLSIFLILLFVLATFSQSSYAQEPPPEYDFPMRMELNIMFYLDLIEEFGFKNKAEEARSKIKSGELEIILREDDPECKCGNKIYLPSFIVEPYESWGKKYGPVSKWPEPRRTAEGVVAASTLLHELVHCLQQTHGDRFSSGYRYHLAHPWFFEDTHWTEVNAYTVQKTFLEEANRSVCLRKDLDKANKTWIKRDIDNKLMEVEDNIKKAPSGQN